MNTRKRMWRKYKGRLWQLAYWIIHPEHDGNLARAREFWKENGGVGEPDDDFVEGFMRGAIGALEKREGKSGGP